MLVLYACTAVGLIGIAVAWWGASGTTDQLVQIPWVNLGVVGVIVLGLGNCSWLLAGRRAVGERRRQLLEGLSAAPSVVPRAEPPARNGTGPRPVWAPGMAHYHRADCQLALGKAAVAATVATHERRGRVPCGMCRP